MVDEKERINQNQFFDLITGEEVSWQSIIYDLIKTEQLDPWDIDLGVLADKYVDTVQQLENMDFFVSSKVLLACSLLLRLKSEILINSYIQSLDEALYGAKDKVKYELERIQLEEGELPILSPRTPLARHKKVTLVELMNALNKAIDTENRRIRKEIRGRQAEKATLEVLPRGEHIPLKIRVKRLFDIVLAHLSQGNDHIRFSSLAPEREEKVAALLPVLHLSNDGKLYLRQKNHFEEIHITLKMAKEEIEEIGKELEKNDGKDSEDVEEEIEELDELDEVEEIDPTDEVVEE